MNGQFFHSDQLQNVVDNLLERSYELEYDFEKHRFDISGNELNSTTYLRLPITLPPPVNLEMSFNSEVKYIMLLVQSGSATVGVFQGEECLEHKVFSAYMVRKKQGKSQIKYLKTKGKSRAGSRVRLASTLQFFENINERLIRYFAEHEFDRIAFSCSKILLPYLFGAKTVTPFTKKDERIYRIPKHLHQPNHEVMLGMQRYLHMAELVGVNLDPNG